MNNNTTIESNLPLLLIIPEKNIGYEKTKYLGILNLIE